MANFKGKAYPPSGVCLPEAGVDRFPWNGLNSLDEDPFGLARAAAKKGRSLSLQTEFLKPPLYRSSHASRCGGKNCG